MFFQHAGDGVGNRLFEGRGAPAARVLLQTVVVDEACQNVVGIRDFFSRLGVSQPNKGNGCLGTKRIGVDGLVVDLVQTQKTLHLESERRHAVHMREGVEGKQKDFLWAVGVHDAVFEPTVAVAVHRVWCRHDSVGGEGGGWSFV